MNLVEMLYNSTVEFGSKESLRYKSNDKYQSLTYTDLWKSIQRFARGLLAQGVAADHKVALLSTNRPEWVISDYAIQWVSGVVVPIYPTIPAGQVEFILKNADVTYVIVENYAQLEKVLYTWPEKLQKVILIEGDVTGPKHSVLSFTEVMRDGQRSELSLPDFRAIPDTQLCSIVHTSGTSGIPKGVMLSHGNIASNVMASLSLLPVEPQDTSLSYLPLSHIFERTVEEYAMLSRGASVVYAESTETIQQNLQEVKPSVLVTVPRLLEKVYSGVQLKVNQAPRPIRALLKKGTQSTQTLGITYRLVDRLLYSKLREGLGGRIRAVVSGGAGLSKEIAEFYIRAGIPIYEGYGMTEAAPVIAANPFGASRPGTVGRVVPGVEVKTAADGELLVRGPNVMLGYYGAPEETANTITEDGWLHTGDIAQLEPDGYIRIVDRKKNILVLATGKNVAPWPIENSISLSPYIAEAILIGDGRKYVGCLVVPDFVALIPLAESLGIRNAVEGREQMLLHPHIQRFLANEIAASVRQFAPFEQPKRAVLLPVELTLEGGELTPTLKVRNKIILQKYGHLIEDMYNGTGYLQIPSPADGTEAEIRSDPTATVAGVAGGDEVASVGAVKKSFPWKRGMLALIVVLIVTAGGLKASAGSLKIPSNLNLVGMIKNIQGNNNKINTVNSKIVGNMKQISNLSGTTAKIGQQLQTLNQGVGTDRQSLTTLNKLSQQEVSLSTSFVGLARTLHTNLSSIAGSSTAQSQSVNQMLAQMSALSASASEMTKVNQSIANQLNTATHKTGTIASEMP